MAREYRWLAASREGLFSPATSSTVTKLIPLMFLLQRAANPDETYCVAAIDIKDAFLEVPQQQPVMVGLPSDYHGSGKYVFMRCIPGQRDGSQRWFDYYVKFT